MELDETDMALVHALNIDGRAPFSKIAEVLGLSDQTVARRYRRLRASSAVRVVGQTSPWRVGHVRWYIRIKCAPATALPVASALARRSDTYWVRMFSGGTEIGCVAQSHTAEHTDALLLQQLPKTPRVNEVTAHSLLHVFFGGPAEHLGLLDILTRDQVEQLRPRIHPTDEVFTLDDADHRMLAVLEQDGRAGFMELAKATGWSESTVRRRLDHLRAAGALFYDVDMDIQLLGFTCEAMMWMSVPPAEIADVGTALAAHPEVAFVAATTGTANLIASVICRDVPAFYRYLTTKVAALKAVNHIETAPVIRTVKRGATLVS
ncbi:AsnC family transcriptional regulator [Kibdelosporangium philippinense]|uniref:AsnC family transcriptional regulator n=1 Tax=Kibdelosporangium philippinense TaxID=211113 RepID=A0ABS8ZEC6_9PSEU|nr:AsnC family transcriptional regulator [Kibdelosporangium philippinense]MCE7005812.1 AsnC family transcriptional regulator [Kibdelosporangium philippinense]